MSTHQGSEVDVSYPERRGDKPREELKRDLEEGLRAEESLGRVFRGKTIVSGGIEKVAFGLGEEENWVAPGSDVSWGLTNKVILGMLNKSPFIPSLAPLLLPYLACK